MFKMYTLHFLLLCCCASTIVMGIVLRDFPSTRNTIPESPTESIKCKTLDSNVAVKNTESVTNNGIQDSMTILSENDSSNSSLITNDHAKVPDEILTNPFAQSGFELEEFENIDHTSFQPVSDLLPTVGFEFLISSEALKKATVIEELASTLEVSDEDDFNAIFIAEENDCEEIHAVEFKDSETKNDSQLLLSMENTNDSFKALSNIEANQSLITDFVVLIPDGAVESFRDNSSMFENADDVMHFSIENVSSLEMGTINADTDFVLLIPDGNVEHFKENSSMFEDGNETGINVSIENVSSLEVATTKSELETHLSTVVKDVSSASSKVPEMTEVVTEKLTENNLVVPTSDEHLLSEMNVVTETTNNNVINNDTSLTNSSVAISEERKCPPGGFCLFSFIFRDTCSKHSDCRGNRLCCKSGCSKKCLDL